MSSSQKGRNLGLPWKLFSLWVLGYYWILQHQLPFLQVCFRAWGFFFLFLLYVCTYVFRGGLWVTGPLNLWERSSCSPNWLFCIWMLFAALLSFPTGKYFLTLIIFFLFFQSLRRGRFLQLFCVSESRAPACLQFKLHKTVPGRVMRQLWGLKVHMCF